MLVKGIKYRKSVVREPICDADFTTFVFELLESHADCFIEGQLMGTCLCYKFLCELLESSIDGQV